MVSLARDVVLGILKAIWGICHFMTNLIIDSNNPYTCVIYVNKSATTEHMKAEVVLSCLLKHKCHLFTQN
jgi:hypothetical protein